MRWRETQAVDEMWEIIAIIVTIVSAVLEFPGLWHIWQDHQRGELRSQVNSSLREAQTLIDVGDFEESNNTNA